MPAVTIRVAEHAGACYGVERALRIAAQAGQEADGPVRTLGPLIHNPIVVSDLEKQGVGMAKRLEDVSSGTVIVRTHGVVPQVIEQAKDLGLAVVDATCPYVKRVHAAAEKLASEGYQVVVIGEAGHPEVEGIVGHASAGAEVINDPAELDGLALAARVGVVVQTTQTAQNVSSIVGALATRVRELRVINTICEATSERQRAANELARISDCMIVIGGKNSGNTRRLAEICQIACPRTHHIEDVSELEAGWFEGCAAIGITAGASTPQSHIERVRTGIEAMVCS